MSNSRSHLQETAIHVYHNTFGDDMRYVASLSCDDSVRTDVALDVAYRNTNTIEAAWVKGDAVQVAQEVSDAGGCRSTSIGDRMLVVKANGDSQWYQVAMAGFDEIEDPAK